MGTDEYQGAFVLDEELEEETADVDDELLDDEEAEDEAADLGLGEEEAI